MKERATFWSVLFVAALWLPLLQRSCGLVEEEDLHGVERSIAAPSLAAGSWLDGSFQAGFEAAFARDLGFHGHLVRTNNQLNLDLFGDLVPGLLKGPDDQLFETTYHPRRGWIEVGDVKRFLARVQKLARLQAKLRDHGIVLLVLISPSKSRTYPESLPAELRRISGLPARTGYGVLRLLLRRWGVHVLDCQQLFLEQKARMPFRLFPKAGTHWNYHGAALAASALMQRIEELGGRDYNDVDIVDWEMSRPRRGSDTDLADLANLWYTGRFVDEVPYPVFSDRQPDPARRCRLLFVGGSFVWQLADTLGARGVCSKLDVFYYYKSRRRYGVWPEPAVPGIKLPIRKNRVELQQTLRDYDAVVIEVNEFVIHKLGFGFVEDACRALGIATVPGPGR